MCFDVSASVARDELEPPLTFSSSPPVSEVGAYLHFLTTELPLTILLACGLLFRLLGWSAAAGVSPWENVPFDSLTLTSSLQVTVLVIMIPLQAAVSRRFHFYTMQLLAAADRRLSLATEVIASVRLVKYFA